MIPSPPLNAVHIGPLTIHFYGIIIALAITTSYILALKIAKEKKISSNEVDNYFFTVIPLSLVFARLYHVSTNWSYYAKNPLLIFAVWNGGLGILGAILGGIAILYYLSKKSKRPFLQITDFLAPLLALGQSIGRWGNYVNQELYGKPTSLPWAVHIDPQNRLNSVKQFSTFHPVFLYESLFSLLNFIVLRFIDNKYHPKTGVISSLYLINYGIIRSIVELVKLDPDSDSKIGLLRIPQYVALLLILAGISLLIIVKKRKPSLHKE